VISFNFKYIYEDLLDIVNINHKVYSSRKNLSKTRFLKLSIRSIGMIMSWALLGTA